MVKSSSANLGETGMTVNQLFMQALAKVSKKGILKFIKAD
jgi:hypothetical protein